MYLILYEMSAKFYNIEDHWKFETTKLDLSNDSDILAWLADKEDTEGQAVKIIYTKELGDDYKKLHL